jgi:energy-coupling factor transport system permease protein
VRPAAALALLAGVATAALLADRLVSVAAIVTLLLVVCLRIRDRRRVVYLVPALATALGVFVISPFLAVEGTHPLWTGPTLPVLGPLDVTTEELRIAAMNALRFAAVGIAFIPYALLLDHDRLVGAASFARRTTLSVALAARLVPTLERDARGFAEAARGRGVQVGGARGYARLLSPLVGGSLERALNLAEAMEARGYGRGGRTRAPEPSWTALDRAALVLAVVLVVAGVLWL